MDFFPEPSNGGLVLDHPIKAANRSKAGNVILTFKTVEAAETARIHADGWVHKLSPDATVPQRLFAVVAHNVPLSIWDGGKDSVKSAITNIELENSDTMAIDFTIAELSWLNGTEAREKTGHGPLMISLKT